MKKRIITIILAALILSSNCMPALAAKIAPVDEAVESKEELDVVDTSVYLTQE